MSNYEHQQDGNSESICIELTNRGQMTALFCQPHPLLAYRTDLDIEDNNAFIPPGETRAITIAAPANSPHGMTLAQTGWRISCWNADDVMIAPSADLLFSIGRTRCDDPRFRRLRRSGAHRRHDRCRRLKGARPDPSALPLLMTSNRRVRFSFAVQPGFATVPPACACIQPIKQMRPRR